MSEQMAGIYVPRAGEKLWIIDTVYIFRATAEETDGAYTALEFELPPGSGTPPHIHTRESEAFYVLEGEVEFVVDGKPLTVKKGEFLHGPANIQHCFVNRTDAPARMLVVAVPAGIEGFFAAFGDPVVDGATEGPALDMTRLLTAAEAYGIKLLG